MYPSELQVAMVGMHAVFYKYSGKEGDKKTLSKGEVKELLKNELSDVFKKVKSQAELDMIFEGLDANADGTVDFKEFVNLVACITMIYNDYFIQKK